MKYSKLPLAVTKLFWPLTKVKTLPVRNNSLS